MPDLPEDVEIDIRPEDIEMQVYRSSGAGGQHINKTSSAVRLIHKPTGIVAACQTQRSQFQNRDYAMRMLKAKLLEIKPNTNIIYITGHEQFALESFSTNPSTFLVKPINTERLRNAFEHLRYPVSKITDESIANEYAGDNLIGRRIAKYRTERNMTREQLAAQLGVTVSTISRWENGKRIPDIVTFLKLAQVLTVEPGDLMY